MAFITLNKNNFFHNLDIIAKQAKNKDKIAIVLKDNAYGHGLIQMAQLAKEFGIKKAVVRNNQEAIKIQNVFEYILILADYPIVGCEKFFYTINDLRAIAKFPKNSKVELKVDTGMHRNGIAMDELEAAFEKIKDAGLDLQAIFTHHRSADELSSEWFWQNKNFESIKQKCKEFSFKDLRFHSANSASLFRHDHFDEDMVRVGIAAYGCLEFPQAILGADLKPVLSVHAKKISSRKLSQGNSIGYGATCTLDKDMIVSNYDFGYGDGFLRISSNNYTTPNGEKLLGRVSMDNSSFASDADTIVVFDDARVIAKSAQTISYEVLTSLKENLQREIIIGG